MSREGERDALPGPQRLGCHRRVRAIVAIPVVISCGAVGAAAGVLFPLHPAAVSRQAPTLVAEPETPRGARPSIVRAADVVAQARSAPREVLPAALTSPAAAPSAPREPLAVAPQSRDASPTAEEPLRPRHRSSERIVRAKRGLHAQQRNRTVAGAPSQAKGSAKGSLSQLPIIGPVAGVLLP